MIIGTRYQWTIIDHRYKISVNHYGVQNQSTAFLMMVLATRWWKPPKRKVVDCMVLLGIHQDPLTVSDIKPTFCKLSEIDSSWGLRVTVMTIRVNSWSFYFEAIWIPKIGCCVGYAGSFYPHNYHPCPFWWSDHHHPYGCLILSSSSLSATFILLTDNRQTNSIYRQHRMAYNKGMIN